MIASVKDIQRFRNTSVSSLYASFPRNEIQIRAFRREDLFPFTLHRLWHIETGFVRTVNYSDSGEVITLGLWGKGDVVGKALSNRQGYEVECLTTVTAHPIVLNQVNIPEVQSHQIQQMETFLNLLHCRPLSLRLWRLIDWLGDRFAICTEEGRLVDMRLTHEAIAEMIGSTRVTVSRMLKEFEAEGRLVRLSKQKLLLTNSNAPQSCPNQ